MAADGVAEQSCARHTAPRQRSVQHAGPQRTTTSEGLIDTISIERPVVSGSVFFTRSHAVRSASVLLQECRRNACASAVAPEPCRAAAAHASERATPRAGVAAQTLWGSGLSHARLLA